MKKINYDELPEADVIINYIKARKKRGLYTLVLTTGLPGTGKSSIDMRLAELVSIELAGKNIITEENVIDDILGLIKFIKNANEKEVCIGVVEEISVLFPSRRALSHDNVVVGKLLDTARKKQIILFANAPIFPAIDKHMRCLGNLYVETLRINRTEKVVVAKALRMQTNPGSGKTYFHWLKRKRKEVHRIFVRKPSSETWKSYEKRKDKFLDELYEELKAKTMKKQGKKEDIVITKPLSAKELRAYDLVVKQQMTGAATAKIMGISPQRVSKIIQTVKLKMEMKTIPKEVEKKVVITNEKEPINRQLATPLAY